jgi:hypothetical protein
MAMAFAPIPVPGTADCLALLPDTTQVSDNLCRPLSAPDRSGKNYTHVTAAQQTFDFGDWQRERQAGRGYHRSYRDGRFPNGVPFRQGMSIWDMLFPLLQPPPFDLASLQAVYPSFPGWWH